ncbi:MAG TPA: EAL domain-containing protein [Nocardioidaceae bacterium]|nr:EAL domain-containing protein [Nocardioidaceae bacterium]
MGRRLPLLAKVGAPVLAVSAASAWFLGQSTVDEVAHQCTALGLDVNGLCANHAALAAIGGKISLLAADVTAMTLVALWLVLDIFVLRRTREIAEVAARAAEGDLSARFGTRLEPGTRDELTRVSAQFDRMVETVADHERAVRDIVDSAYDAFVSMDDRGYIVDWSARAEQLFGWSREEAIGQELGGLIVPERYREPHRNGVANYSESGTDRFVGHPMEMSALRRDGTEVPVELVIWTTHVDGELRFHSFLRDISERKQMQEQLEHQAFHDALTGLANRSLFADRLEHALRRPGAGVGVIFCDLDDFKTVNDSLGHAAGDRVLLTVAQRLADATRPVDTLARLAGDEFAVLVEDATDDETVAIADQMRVALRPPVEVAGREVIARASLGLATTATLSSGPVPTPVRRVDAAEAATMAEELLRNADVAMYGAKHHGKDTMRRFHAEMHLEAVERLTLRTDLEGSIRKNELRVVYQPYVDASTGRITGCEALVRWDHPVRGLISPVEFIPLAEQTGFIRELGHWVLIQACAQLSAWRREAASGSGFTMSVNVSVRQLEEPGFVDDVRRILETSGVDPADVILEITESVLTHDDDVVGRLSELKGLGVSLAIDDFGTGYSSLARLKSLPVDVVKIDRSFVTPLSEATMADAAMVTAIVQIAASRNLRTVAEGVETAEQLSVVQTLGCDVVQGFLCYRPMSSVQLTERLQQQAPACPENLPSIA